MKDELEAMETYIKELGGLKKYEEAQRLEQEISELRARLSQMLAETDRLKNELLISKKAQQEGCGLREALSKAEREVSMLEKTKAILEGKDVTLEVATQEFVKASEAEIKAGVEREFEGLRKNFEAGVPRLVYDKLLAILKEREWPPEIAQVIAGEAQKKAKSQLDDEFKRRVSEKALDRLRELKRTEWRPFLEEQASRIASNLKALVAEFQGRWHFTCDRCQGKVTVEIGPREIAALLKGDRVAECSRCRDFNLPPAPPFAAHKINGSALEGLLVAYLTDKGPPAKASTERSPEKE